MKKILLATALMSITALTFGQQSQPAQDVTTKSEPASIKSLALESTLPARTVKMKDISGKEISLGEALKKNGLLVMFSCNTCPYVIKNQDRTKNICNYAELNHVGVVVVNSNEAQRNNADAFSAMQQYGKAQDYDWYYAVDENAKVADAFGATRTPEVYLFDKEGKLVYKGAIDDNPSKAEEVHQTFLKNAIDEMVAGKDVAVKESKSVGCTIKRTTTM